MRGKYKIPAMMIDGKMVDFSKLTIEELDELKEKIEAKQEEIRKELYEML